MLTLGVNLYNSIYVGDKRFVLTKIYDNENVRLSSDNQDFNIDMDSLIQIGNGVGAQVCFGVDQGGGFARLNFEGPRTIPILRSKVYWAQQEDREVEIGKV